MKRRSFIRQEKGFFSREEGFTRNDGTGDRGNTGGRFSIIGHINGAVFFLQKYRIANLNRPIAYCFLLLPFMASRF